MFNFFVFHLPLKLSHRFVKSILPYFLCCFFLSCGRDGSQPSGKGSVPPAEALATFELEEGFQLELIASEPLLADPVDMEIDEFGRLFVVEMPGYPLDKGNTGRIRMLSDSDGDGIMDKSIVFADNLLFPNGILRWKKGFLVTDAPNVLYFEDSNGDGLADRRDTVLTGFSLSNPHVNVNNPVYGLDNWIYLSHMGHIGARKYDDLFGDRGAEIVYHGIPESASLPKNANGRSVRFRPEVLELEMNSARSQFGHTFDAWGRYFLTHNQNHVYHEVIASKYVDRNPHLLVSNATESISDHGNETEIFQITTHPDRQLFTPVGMTTSSSGITAYTGGLFPEPFGDNVAFVAESVSNLVHVDVLKEKGASFEASRHREHKEFFASKDSWSRPVNMYVGPDGALYVLDYYRKIIEHPEWMADEAVEEGGLYDGIGMGRIYRITPNGTGKAEWISGLDLGKQTPKEWVSHLSSPNSWWRINAQRLLVDAADNSVVPMLRQMAIHPTSAEGRLHALWTLQGMGKLDPDLIVKGFYDPEPGVRENVIKLTELHKGEMSYFLTDLLSLKDDPSPRVRFQLLCMLGYLDAPDVTAVREQLLFDDLTDEWVQVAALSASYTTDQAHHLLQRAIQRFNPEIQSYSKLLSKLTYMVTVAENSPYVSKLLDACLASSGKEPRGWQSGVLTGIVEGIKANPKSAQNIQKAEGQLVNAYFEHSLPEVRKSIFSLISALGIEDSGILEKGIQRALAIALDTSRKEGRRVESLRFLSHGDFGNQRQQLQDLLVAREAVSVQLAAMQALGTLEGTAVTSDMLSRWEVLTPEIRVAALEAFLLEEGRVKLLLDALETKKVSGSLIDYRKRVRLMNQANVELRNRARMLLTIDEGQEVNRKFQQALTLTANPEDGKAVYMQNCAQCHTYRGKNGVAFGPDLGTVHNWLSKDIMANILDPGLSIAQGFDLWDITLLDGTNVQGMILSETSSAINLRISPGVEKELNRKEIEEIKSLSMSLMPPQASELTLQEMSDLIAYIKRGD